MAAVLLNKLQPGKTYTVAVKAIDSDGNVSPNSLTYTFTTPTTNLDGTALVGYNSAVNVAVGASGAMTAGTLSQTGLQAAGTLDLYDVWSKTVNTGSGYTNLTGSIGGTIIINKNGILGYSITSSATSGSSQGTAKFLLDNKNGDAYFNGTIWTTSKVGTLPIADWTASQINNSPLVGSAYNVAASALLSADSASTNALNYLGVKNTSISGSALISSANTITNASNQLTTISSNGITITTASGASASTASGARIVLNSVGFASYNASGSPTVTITAADGTARFTGSVIATAGLIGGFNLTASNQNGDAQMYIGTASQQNWTGMIPGTQWSFFSGALDNTGSAALFRVSNAGLLYAQNAVITGSITAQYGVIGNWNIGSQSLWAGDVGVQNFAGMIPGTTNVFFGGATSSAADNATFRVTNTGSVLATAGQIGGWSLGQTSLSSRNTKNIFSQYDPSFESGDYVNYWKSSFYSVAGFSSYILSDSSKVDGLKSIVVGRIATSGILGNFYTYPFAKMYKNPTTLQRFSIADLNLTPGNTYVFSAYVNSGTNWSTAQVGVYVDQYTASSGGTLKGSSTAGNTVPSGTWTRVSSSFTASSNSYFEFIVWSDAADTWYAGYPTTADDIFYVDAVQLESGNTATTYQINNAIVMSSSAGSSPMQFGTPTNDGGIISNLSVSPEGVLNTKGLTLYGTQPFNIATGVATSSSAAFTTITLPAGRFSATPRVTATIRSNVFSALSGYYSIYVGNESKSSFTVYTASGSTSTTGNSFSWIAVQI